ncbi:hypothetical protein GS539_29010 [Rhodococcus hoagii]|nr:hypothetical protein [Prescottella equi]
MPEMNPTREPAGRIELSDEWAVEAQPPVQVSLFGKPYDIRRDFTGKEVLEFSRLLRKTPEVDEDGKTTDDAVKDLWEERFLFILADGDPGQLAGDIGEQNTVSQTSSSTPSTSTRACSTLRETSARSNRPPHQGWVERHLRRIPKPLPPEPPAATPRHPVA